MTIGEKILELRQKAKMTQRELAEKLNVSDKVVSRWETEKSLPDIEMILKISRLFNISISQLYDCEDVDIDNEEKINKGRIWSFIKYNIVSYAFLCVIPLLFLFYNHIVINILSPNQSKTVKVILIVTYIVAFVLFILAIIFEILQFIKLKLYSDDKFYKEQYQKVLKIYGSIFVGLFLLSILCCIAIFYWF